MTFFYPLRNKKAFEIFDKIHNAALLEAKQVGERQKLKMRVEILRPVHLGLTAYKHGTGTKSYTLQQNCALFIAGIRNFDPGFDYQKWYKGQEYIGDWLVRDVNKYQEQMGAYAGNLDRYIFRSGEVMKVTSNSTVTPTPADVDGWIVAFVVMPESLADSKIVV